MTPDGTTKDKVLALSEAERELANLELAEQARLQGIVDSIGLGDKISYEGQEYTVTENPTADNGNRFVLTAPGKPVFRATEKQLLKTFQTGKAILTPIVAPIERQSVTTSTMEASNSNGVRGLVRDLLGDTRVFDLFIDVNNREKMGTADFKEILPENATLNDLSADQETSLAKLILKKHGSENPTDEDAEEYMIKLKQLLRGQKQEETKKIEGEPLKKIREVTSDEDTKEYIIDGRHFSYDKPNSIAMRADGTSVKVTVESYNPYGDVVTLSCINEATGEKEHFDRVPFAQFLAWQETPTATPEAWTPEDEARLIEIDSQIASMETQIQGVESFLNNSLSGKKESIEIFREKNEETVIAFIQDQISLIENNPKEYLTRERDSAKNTLEFVRGNEEYTEEYKKESEVSWTKTIQAFQEYLDVLETIPTLDKLKEDQKALSAKKEKTQKTPEFIKPSAEVERELRNQIIANIETLEQDPVVQTFMKGALGEYTDQAVGVTDTSTSEAIGIMLEKVTRAKDNFQREVWLPHRVNIIQSLVDSGYVKLPKKE